MNILFLNETLAVGGIEKVTLALANKFVLENHQVCVYCFWDYYKDLEDVFDKRISIYYGNGRRAIRNNIEAIRNIIINHNIDVVINQNGTSIFFTYVLFKAAKGLKVKTISVHHNAPSFGTNAQNVWLKISREKNFVKRVFLKLLRYIYVVENKIMMRYAYYHSDYYMLLSKSFISEFAKFTGIKTPKRLLIQTNPITLSSSERIDNSVKKNKTIIYVGRFEETQKRVSRVLNLWKELQCDMPDWSLKLVGDGEDRKIYEKYVFDHNLKNVSFEGYRDPLPYYKEAVILLLTSDYEGFGLVISECMHCRTIPIVLASYSSVYDIINNGSNGYIMPIPFDINEWKSTVLSLVNDDKLIAELSNKAEEDSHEFDIDNIYKQWLDHMQLILRN